MTRQTTGVDGLGVVHGCEPGAEASYGVRSWGTYCGAWASAPKIEPSRVVTCMTCLVRQARSHVDEKP